MSDIHESPTTNKRLASNINHYHESPKSSLLFTAQSQSFFKGGRAIKKVVNPFEPKDVSVLANDTCSPSMFTTTAVVGSQEFSWSIDDVSRIKPVEFDSPCSIVDEADENRESQAQEAIEKYFSQTHSVVTPEGAYQGQWVSPVVSTPRSSWVSTSSPTSSRSSEQFSGSELNSSLMRKKLLFNQDDTDLSPVKAHGDSSSPEHGSKRSKHDWSFDEKVSPLSTPTLSPINSVHDDSDLPERFEPTEETSEQGNSFSNFASSTAMVNKTESNSESGYNSNDWNITNNFIKN